VVLGYTIANDVTARTCRNPTASGPGRRFRHVLPTRPVLVTGIDPSDLRLTTRLNGKTVQDGRTSQLIHDIPAIVAFVTAAFTLLPGDVILTAPQAA